LLAMAACSTAGFTAQCQVQRSRNLRQGTRCVYTPQALVPPAISLGAGMLGGAIGVGVSYPLDTIKTKTQSYASDGSPNPLALAAKIVQQEGMGGFYSGVSSTMVGQALIKGVTFFAFEAAKPAFSSIGLLAPFALVLAACLSGALGSFVVTPVERIKCVMQSREAGVYAHPLECTSELLRSDGLSGLLFRGLGATLLREIPAYGFYFSTYELTKAAWSARLCRPPSSRSSAAHSPVQWPGSQSTLSTWSRRTSK